MLIQCKGKDCKNVFEKRIRDKRDKNLYCCKTCVLSWTRTKEHQSHAGKIGALKVIEKYRGTGTKTYVKENGRHQHRLVAEQILGRKLKENEIVHHKDNNKKNNDPSNLEVMTQAEHAREHFKKYGPLCLKCELPNKRGYAYCSHHQWRFERYKEL